MQFKKGNKPEVRHSHRYFYRDHHQHWISSFQYWSRLDILVAYMFWFVQQCERGIVSYAKRAVPCGGLLAALCRRDTGHIECRYRATESYTLLTY